MENENVELNEKLKTSEGILNSEYLRKYIDDFCGCVFEFLQQKTHLPAVMNEIVAMSYG